MPGHVDRRQRSNGGFRQAKCTSYLATVPKPIWLYVADIDEYAKYSREFYVNPLETPYWCARTPSELDALIRRTTPEKARQNCREVLEYYGAHETGRASEAAARYICSALSESS